MQPFPCRPPPRSTRVWSTRTNPLHAHAVSGTTLGLTSRISQGDNSVDDSRLVPELTLPYSNDLPSYRFELRGVRSVLRSIVQNLRSPEGSVSSRGCVVDRTTVPEAAIDKNRDFFSHDRHIGTCATDTGA